MPEPVFESGSVRPDTGSLEDTRDALRSLRSLRSVRRNLRGPNSRGAHSTDDAALDVRMNRRYGYKMIVTAELNALGRRVLGDAPEEA